MSGLFKKEYLEKIKREEEEKRKRWFIYLVIIYKKINMIMLLISILINASVIVYMIYNFNVGIILFILNQYFLVLSYMRLRKEKKDK